MSLDRGFEKGLELILIPEAHSVNILGYESKFLSHPIIYGELQSPSTSSLFRYDIYAQVCVFTHTHILVCSSSGIPLIGSFMGRSLDINFILLKAPFP